MHFITFPVATSTIFPLSNSTKGGQLVTEYNLKCREMTATNPAIKYTVGPSFIHSTDDFKVTLAEDTSGNTTSSSILQVAPGRAVINGHNIESYAPVTIDLSVTNAELIRNSQEPLYGNLSIGFRSYFSTENTMAGSMLVENTDDMFVGIQLVIEKTSEFITPNDSPTDQSRVNADLKLADFTFVNGVISASSISMNTDATRYIPSERIADFDSILNEKYVTSENLDDNKFYTYSGLNGWCNSTGSLMVWDSRAWDSVKTTTPPSLAQADFLTDVLGNVHLVIPHKQQDGILNDNGDRLYYKDRDIQVPTADYATGTSGIVTGAYTQKIKDLASVLSTYKEFTNGKQIMYLDTLTSTSTGLSYVFPTDLSSYTVGDYILVREDYTVTGPIDDAAAPSTMYFVLPGGVTAITWSSTNKPSGIRLGTPAVIYAGDGAYPNPPTSSHPNAEELLDMFAYTSYKGVVNDYFELQYHNVDDTQTTSYYYKVSAAGPKMWSDPVLLTGGIPLATSDHIGGFYNIPADSAYMDSGYVYMDDTGHLRLMDYSLLRTGTLAYQLGDDISIASNSTLSYLQDYLDEYVNARIAFKTNDTLTDTPTMIHVYIPLPYDVGGTLNIYNIDSRFDTGVYLHFTVPDTKKDYSGITINITNCQRVRIDSSITMLQNGPTFNVYRSCLYYDVNVINYIRNCHFSDIGFTGFEDLTIWFSRFTESDPDLIVNGMEISQPNVAMATQDIAFWGNDIVNDNHYSCALRSITLSGNGQLIGCSMYVSNDSTQTVNTTQHVIIGDKFTLPQGSQLNYPVACINQPLKVTGVFTTAYLDDSRTNWITTETSFSALTGVYSAASGVSDGSIAFNSSTTLVPTTYTNVTSLDCWEPGTYHIFYGGTTV